MERPYTFHALEISYFSAKVRPALRYKRLWHEEVRADLPEIMNRTGLAFIPIVITPENDTWQDTSEILDHLEERHPDPPLFPSSPVQRLACFLVELYADEFGIIPAMHYRWGSPLGERTTRARFAAMIGDADIATMAADRMAAARFALGATEETAPAIEEHTRDLLGALCAHFEAYPYLLGSRISMADCALMAPIYGHLFNDLVSRRLLLEAAVPVVGWIERCNYPSTATRGHWEADDVLPSTLREVLAVMGCDAVPVILDTVRYIEEWANDQTARPEAGAANRSDRNGGFAGNEDRGGPPHSRKGTIEPPRTVGRCKTELRGTEFERIAQPYSLWMLERCLGEYRRLAPDERTRVDDAVAGTGWDSLLAYEPRHRAYKRGFTLLID